MRYRLGILSTHPIQYYAPFYRRLAAHPQIDLTVFYCHRQTSEEQGKAGFGVSFDWDVPLYDGYRHIFLENRAKHPNVSTFFGCDTPDIERFIADEKFDAFLVHGWNVKSYWQAMRACRRKRVPIFVRGDSQLNTPRSFPKRFFKFIFYRWFIPKFDAYLVVGKRAEEYYRHYGAVKEKMFFCPHAVDNDYFSRASAALAPRRNELRRAWGLPEDAVVFLFAGKMLPMKRPRDFVEAVRIAHEANPKVYGFAVGDGPLRTTLEEDCRKRNISVVFAGFLNQSRIPEAYAVSDVIVLPSDGRETWGLVVNEAMASGISAIVSDKVGCALDLVEVQKTGLIFRMGDVNGLAEILKRLALDEVSRRRMAKQAVEIIQTYSFETAVQGILRALEVSQQRSPKYCWTSFDRRRTI